MKQIAFLKLLPLLFFYSSITHAQGVEFFNGTWDEALQQAREEGKLVYLDAYTEWCGWCKVMDKNTFSDAKVGDFMRANFIPVQLDMEEGEGLRLSMKYRVRSFPTSLIFDGNGRLVYRKSGYAPPEDFIGMLDKARNPENWLNLPGVSPSIELDYPPFFITAMTKGEDRKWPSDTTVLDFLDGISDWSAEVPWTVIYTFHGIPRIQEYVLENREKLGKLYGSDEVGDIVFSIMYGRMYDAVERKSTDSYDSLMASIPAVFPDETPQMTAYFKQAYCELTEDWPCVVACIQERIDTASTLPHSMVNNIAWTLFEKCDDGSCLGAATTWMKRVVAEYPQYMYIDTYAALLYKTGSYEQAKEEAVRAIEVGKKNSEDVASTEELLAKIVEKLESGS